jgi:hypothetical protein
MNGGTGVVPNLDSIEEFRLLTNNFDPEYGNYNGGIVNVVTKSGSDAFHGNMFEFFRNTNLDARNYFSPERAEFNQNQPGGTVGGPLVRGKVFFFGDYQATRTTQGIETGNISVPSLLNRSGNFSDIAGDLDGVVNGPYFANVLSQRLGYDGAVRVSGRRDPAARVVVARPEAAVARAVAERRRQHAVDGRVRADSA